MDAAVKRPQFHYYKDGKKVGEFTGDTDAALEVSHGPSLASLRPHVARAILIKSRVLEADESIGATQRSVAAHAH